MTKKFHTVFATFLIIVFINTAVLAKEVHVMHGWPAQQGDAFRKIVTAFETKHPDIDIIVEVVGRDRPAILATRLAAGNPPDITPHPWLGLQTAWAQSEQIVSLEELVDPSELLDSVKHLGYVDGKLYGLFVFPSVKSLVWYNKKAFQTKGYAPPKNWDEMISLSNAIVADGGVPWIIGLESGAASGWPGTDWIEDLLLRSAGPHIYDQWVNHDIPWTHPAVKKAFEYFGQIALNPKYTLGGPTGALTTNFGDAPSALFSSPMHAYMHRQATFIQGFLRRQNPQLRAGIDYDVFPFPPIDPETRGDAPVLVAGDVVNCFNQRPEVIQFAAFLISEAAQNIWVTELGELSSNKNTDPSLYTNPIIKKAWNILLKAHISRYDGSDMMPRAVGTGTFWSGVLDYVSGVPLDAVLETIENSAVEAYSN
jgi:alpha-glucoside transport system substrate-binding protein